MKKWVVCLLVGFVLVSGFSALSIASAPDDSGVLPGMPFNLTGHDMEETGAEMCPEGVKTIGAFLAALQKKDYKTMYDLLDGPSKENYSYEKAIFDFNLLVYKEYTISSVNAVGENFEFLLSSGDWRDGDKDTKKMIISGKTFKIIMPTKSSPFKDSVGNSF